MSRSTLLLLALASTLTACLDDEAPRAPSVRLFHDGAERAEYLRGARGWEPLGFEFAIGDPIVTEPEHPECSRKWYERVQRLGSEDCQISITIVVDPLLIERTGFDAAAGRDSRVVYLDDLILESHTPAALHYLTVAVAHEVGHIVLDTPLHTDGGIMGGATATMRDVDYELACSSIGLGCE